MSTRSRRRAAAIQSCSKSSPRSPEEAARAIGKKIVVLNAGVERDFGTISATIAQQRVGALLVGASPRANAEKIVADMLARARNINDTPELRCRISKITAFGRFLTDALDRRWLGADQRHRDRCSSTRP